MCVLSLDKIEAMATDGRVGRERKAMDIDIEVATARTQGPEGTKRFGAALGEVLLPGDVLVFEGDLGSGKTVMIKGIAQGLGLSADAVHSPTFTLVHEHTGETSLYHIDLYRLETSGEELEDELEALGFDRYFDPQDGVTAVEWGGMAGNLLPPVRFTVAIKAEGDERHISVRAIQVPQERVASIRRHLQERGVLST